MQTKSIIRVEQTNWQTSEPEIKHIRTAVFVEEQNVPEEIDFDGLDDQCIHWLAYDNNGLPVGTGRLLPDGHFGRMAVLKPNRKRGVGDAIMRAAIASAAAAKLPEIYLHAQLTALPFYSGLGFIGYGEEFIDADMPHIAMRLTL
jgi:predicted GNAT family N-acyltransferase